MAVQRFIQSKKNSHELVYILKNSCFGNGKLKNRVPVILIKIAKDIKGCCKVTSQTSS